MLEKHKPSAGRTTGRRAPVFSGGRGQTARPPPDEATANKHPV